MDNGDESINSKSSPYPSQKRLRPTGLQKTMEGYDYHVPHKTEISWCLQKTAEHKRRRLFDGLDSEPDDFTDHNGSRPNRSDFRECSRSFGKSSAGSQPGAGECRNRTTPRDDDERNWRLLVRRTSPRRLQPSIADGGIQEIRAEGNHLVRKRAPGAESHRPRTWRCQRNGIGGSN